MKAARRNMDGFGVGLMVLLCMVWGQQVAIKASAHDIALIMQVALRSGMSAFLVGVVMFARSESLCQALGRKISASCTPDV